MSTFRITAIAVCVGLAWCSVAPAAITTTGSVSDSGSYQIVVGYNAEGTLTIDGGSDLQRTNNYIGNGANWTAAATVTGSGSTWSGKLVLVGNSGPGTLYVLNGGEVSNSNGYIGYNASAAPSAAIVSGAGSAWTNSTHLYVGFIGSGTLTVSNGGHVSANAIYGSLGNLLGNGTVSAQGAVLDGDLVFDGTHGANQTLSFGAGGLLILNVNGSGRLGAGHQGAGTLRIADGAAVASTMGVLGHRSGAAGAATVTGPGSTWTNSAVIVGENGVGELNVLAGGNVVTQYNASLGAESFFNISTGTATIDGAGSMWSCGDNLRVGHRGNGTLNIRAGGQVSNDYGYLGYDAGAAGTAEVGSGSTWTNRNALSIGRSGAGTLIVEAGGRVSNTTAYLGQGSGSSGTATIRGAGSTWTNSGNLYVGQSGHATLNVGYGGRVTTDSLSVNSVSDVNLDVSGNDIIVLGDAGIVGTLVNEGAVNFHIGPFLPVGVYRPISEFAGRTMTWSGSGSYQAFGGYWNPVDRTLTVSAATRGNLGNDTVVVSFSRFQVTDPGSGQSVGAGFGAVPGGTTFSADLIDPTDQAALAAMLGPQEEVLAGWDFTTTLTGQDVLLSFDIGLGMRDLAFWHLNGGGWSSYLPDSFTYDAAGNVSFTVDQFSGYAVTGVPEPASLALLALGGLTLGRLTLTRRRRRP